MSVETWFDTIQKIYIAYYGRPADPGGLLHWAGALDAHGGDVAAIIDAFANSVEATERFGGLSAEDTITRLYNQLFNRDPESAEVVDWWVGQLENNPDVTPQSIALALLEGAQNQDATAVAEKLAAAGEFTQYLSDNGLEGAYQGFAAAQEVAGWLDWTSQNGGLASAPDRSAGITSLLAVLEEGLAVSAHDVTVYEVDGEATVTVTRTGVYGRQVIDFITDPVSARESDFTAVEGSIVFEPGESFKKIVIPVTEDGVYEYNEYFKLLLSDREGTLLDSARVHVSDENRAPVALPDGGVMEEDETTLTIDVLANDFDPDPYDSVYVFKVEGETLSSDESVTLESGALVTLNGDGTLTYDLNDSVAWGTADQFEYTISDENGGLDTGRVMVNFQPLLVDFESLDFDQAPIPLGYEGFDWVVPGGQLYVLDGDAYGPSGYNAAGTIVGFTPSAVEPLTVTPSDSDLQFMISEVELTSAWDSSQNVRINGYLDDTLIGTRDVQITNTGSLLVEFDWGLIDTLEFDALDGEHMVFDNFLFLVPADFGLII